MELYKKTHLSQKTYKEVTLAELAAESGLPETASIQAHVNRICHVGDFMSVAYGETWSQRVGTRTDEIYGPSEVK